MTAATASQSAPAQGAALKQYDPAKAIEGMFNGCLTRLGYVLKDPESYGNSTPYVLAECSKRFQDALDDCEITILNAKWYLEQKLAENKKKRKAEAEAKAKEASAANAAAKRKHDEVAEPSEPQPVETPTKRAKSGDESPPKPSATSQTSPSTKTQSKPTESSQQPAKASSQPQVQTNSQSASKEDSKPTEQDKSAQEEKKQEQPDQSDSQFNADDYVKPSPPPTSALTNDEAFFESMFGEPTEDANDMTNADDMDLDFLNDFVQDPSINNTTTTNSTQPHTQTQTQTQNQPQTQTQTQTQPQTQTQTQSTQQSSLNSFLPGLEQYANQTDDTNTASNLDAQNQESNPFTAEFEPNIFDDMLNDSLEVFGGDGTDFANVNVGNPDETNINFDDIFGDGDFN